MANFYKESAAGRLTVRTEIESLALPTEFDEPEYQAAVNLDHVSSERHVADEALQDKFLTH
jgi:hypothetical protein